MRRAADHAPAADALAPRYLRFVRSLAGASGALAGIALGAAATMSSGCSSCSGICGGPLYQPPRDAQVGADAMTEVHDGPLGAGDGAAAEVAVDAADAGAAGDTGEVETAGDGARADAVALDAATGGGPLTAPLLPAALVA
jgi:hypothetical protein